MVSTVLGVGTGVFLIAVVWIMALVFGLILLRGAGPVKLAVLPVFLLALVITLALVLFPRSAETVSPFRQSEIVDKLFIGRYVLLCVAGAAFLVALFTLLPYQLLEPVYAKALRAH